VNEISDGIQFRFSQSPTYVQAIVNLYTLHYIESEIIFRCDVAYHISLDVRLLLVEIHFSFASRWQFFVCHCRTGSEL